MSASKDPETTELGAHLGGARTVEAKLVVVGGPDEGHEVPLAVLTEVGTDPSCELTLTDSSVSRKHAQFTHQHGAIRVKDLGSRNGTLLGGARIVEADLPLGSVLTLGRTQVAVHPRWRVREVPPSTAKQFGRLFGESLAMREVFAMLERVAATEVTVLVEGESGTGKELVAQSIHSASARAGQPYVVFDCGAVPAELAESELFGHKKGAFSGAIADRPGAFQRADGGTICLDEIGELPLELQPKLLRVLETGQIKPVGEDTHRAVDVRVIAATNRDLFAEARKGRFRSDLLYRLEVVRIRLPPLRQRPEDVPGLVALLLEGRLPEGDRIEGHNLDRLLGYGFPGNVRELKNALSRAIALSRRPDEPLVPFDKLVFNLGPASHSPASIGAEYPGVAAAVPYKEARAQLMDSFDRAYVGALLARHKNNVSRAAAAAGVSRTFLYELIKRTTGEEPGPESSR